MTQTKLSPTDKRHAFIKEVTAPLEERAKQILAFRAAGMEIEDLPLEDLKKIAQRMAEEGPALGKTEVWKIACAFADAQINSPRGEEEAFVRWAVLQGSIRMGWVA